MRKLYVLSKAHDDKPRRLIGELTEEDGEYTFEYKLGGKFHEWFLRLKEFPQPDKIYKGSEVRPFIERIVPKPNDTYINYALQAAKLSEYDEWSFLKYCGRFSPHEDAYIFENMPQGAIVYA